MPEKRNGHKVVKGLADLTPDPKNANRGTKRGLGLLDNSLRQYGAGRSILADKNGVIVAGNKTLDRAVDIGLPVRVVETDGTELVVVQRTDLDIDTPDGRMMAYNDNRVAQVDLDWNPDQLLADVNAGIDLAGLFGKDDLDAILREAEGYNTPVDDPGADDSRAAELQAKWGTATGQLWQIGTHKLLCGDCTVRENVERVMGGEKAGLLLTDPPYGINASGMTMGSHQSSLPREQRLSHGQTWDDKRPAIDDLLTLAQWVCIWGGNYFADVLPPTNDWLCWWKKNDGLSFSEFELAWTNYGRQSRHLAHHWGDEKKSHITQKPTEVMAFAIEKCPGADGPVLDPFSGSGTTIVACERLGRKCRAIEISPAYVAVTLERLSLMGLSPELIAQ